MNSELIWAVGAAVAGLLVGASMVYPPGGLFTCLLGLSLFLHLVSAAASRTALLRAFIFMLALGSTSGFWVPAALRELGANPLESQFGLILTVAWAAGPHIAIIGLLVRSIRHQSQLTRCAAIGSIVFAADQAILMMPGGVPWTLWGYAAIETPGLTQLASVADVPLVSASLAMGAWALSELCRSGCSRAKRRVPATVLCSIGLTALCGLPFAQFLDETRRRSPGPRVHFLAIQPNLPRNERLIPLQPLQLANAERLKRFTVSALRESNSSPMTTVVWPENSLVLESQRGFAGIENSLKGMGTYLIAGVSSDPGQDRSVAVANMIVALDRSGETEGSVTKALAVPVIEGEMETRLAKAATWAVGQAASGRKIAAHRRVEPLESSSRAVVMLCFEALFPQIAEERRPEPASIILNLADDSWISSAVPTHQLTTIFRFRAIEQRLPAIRVAHGGLTTSFDQFGEPIQSLPLDQYGWLELETGFSERIPVLERMRFLALPIGSGLLAFLAYPRLSRLGSRRRASPIETDFPHEHHHEKL